MKTWSIKQKLFRQRKLRLLLLFLIFFALVLGLAVVPLEKGSAGKIQTNFDGLWWAVSTVTTIGYGDVVPVTFKGRLVGMVLQVVGAVVFGILIAVVSNLMSRTQEEFYWNRLFERLDRLETQLNDLHKHTRFIVKEKTEDESALTSEEKNENE